MKKENKVFEVYLITGEKVSISAEKWEFDYADRRRVAFLTDRIAVAVFMLAGICGIKEV